MKRYLQGSRRPSALSALPRLLDKIVQADPVVAWNLNLL